MSNFSPNRPKPPCQQCFQPCLKRPRRLVAPQLGTDALNSLDRVTVEVLRDGTSDDFALGSILAFGLNR